MNSAKNIGRVVGLLFLAQALLAVPVYTEVGMMRSVIAPDFLTNAAGSAMQVRVAVLLTFVLSALTLAAALTAWPVLFRHSQRMALLFLSLCVVGVATQALEAAATRDMVSMSLLYAKPDAPKELFATLGALARSTWSSTHFVNLALGHLKAFVFYVIIYRFALVPRALGGVGIAATLLSMTAATMPLLGYSFSYLMIMPAGLMQLVLSLWLTFKGFAERHSSTD
ncbi:MAG TPA: DUF4386 domain-containing protein [Pyrinomonadaceae bacterium]|nr:DUF4386 domain-containing protein [Pyrinomonadaceae bacterium]